MSISQSDSPSSATHPTILRLSEKFNSPDSDISYQSSDHVRFLVHKDNLRVTAVGFPLETENQPDRPILLPETGEVLDYIFRFCYPERHPDLSTLDFEIFSQIADTAERYKVFAAMNVCNIRMNKILPHHATEVLVYATKHDYPKLLMKTAQLVIDIPLPKILPFLPPYLVVPWVLHREKYVNVLQTAIGDFHKISEEPTSKFCYTCENIGVIAKREEILKDLCSEKGLRTLFNFSVLLRTHGCPAEMEDEASVAWRRSIEASIGDIPPFSYEI